MNQRTLEPPTDAWRVREKRDKAERTGRPLPSRPFHLVALSSSHPISESPRTFILGIPLHTVSMEEAILAIMERLDAVHPSQVCFVNAHCANLAYREPEYFRVLQTAALSLPDGVGLRLAGQLLGRPILHNVNGTDLFPFLCAALEESNAGVFLLGGRPGVPEAVRDWLSLHYPRAQVHGWRHGYFSAEEEPRIVRQIADSGARLLLVALGAPLQDLWISRHLPALGVKVAMGVGGLFDFYSGRLPRAPFWLRSHGGEWAYRLYQEPLRLWKRYLIGNPLFLSRVLRERFHCLGQNFDAQRWSVNTIRKTSPP